LRNRRLENADRGRVDGGKKGDEELCVVSIEMMTDAGRGKDGTKWSCIEGEQKWAKD
jgi:hypothetical protein